MTGFCELGLSTFVYDGDGNRVKKTDNGETVLYVNKYYEKNLTTGNVTTYYYAGGQMIAEREATTLRYLHQDGLASTSLMTDASGGSLGTVKYSTFGAVRSGSVPSDILFKGQRLDDTGLYYSGAGFYDSNIGSFIKPHTRVKNLNSPQSLNSYFSNTPAKSISRAGRIQQPPALAPASAVSAPALAPAPELTVPMHEPPAQVAAEQATAEPATTEQAPPPQPPAVSAVEEPAAENNYQSLIATALAYARTSQITYMNVGYTTILLPIKTG